MRVMRTRYMTLDEIEATGNHQINEDARINMERVAQQIHDQNITDQMIQEGLMNGTATTVAETTPLTYTDIVGAAATLDRRPGPEWQVHPETLPYRHGAWWWAYTERSLHPGPA